MVLCIETTLKLNTITVLQHYFNLCSFKAKKHNCITKLDYDSVLNYSVHAGTQHFTTYFFTYILLY